MHAVAVEDSRQLHSIPAARVALIERIARSAGARRAPRAHATLPAGVLPRGRRGGPGGAHAAGALAGRAGAPELRGAPPPRALAGAGLQPRARRGRLRVPAHARAHGHRRHAVPGRLPRHGVRPRRPRGAPDRAPGAAGQARPPRAAAGHRHQRRRAPRRRSPGSCTRSTASPMRRPLQKLQQDLETTLADVRVAVRDWAPMRGAGARAHQRARHQPPAAAAGGDQRGGAAARLDGGPALRVPRLPPLPAAARAQRGPAPARARLGTRDPRAHATRQAAHDARPCCAARCAPRRASRNCSSSPRPTPPPPCIAASCSTTSASRPSIARGRVERRAPLPRTVDLDRLPLAARATSRCCATRSTASSSTSGSTRRATTARRCSTCWRPTRAMSCSRPDVPDLIRIVRGVVNLYERRTVRLLVRRDPYHRFYSCLVYVPRDRYNTEVRQRIEAIARAGFGGTGVESQAQISGASHARVHVVVRTDPAQARKPDFARIERRIAEAALTWSDRLREVLVERLGEAAGLAARRSLPARLSARLPGGRGARRGARGPRRPRGAAASSPRSLRLSLYRPPGQGRSAAPEDRTSSASRCRSPTCCRCWRTSACG